MVAAIPKSGIKRLVKQIGTDLGTSGLHRQEKASGQGIMVPLVRLYGVGATQCRTDRCRWDDLVSM
jgi:hypothetical protein